MTKAKTNALEALRALIAERQQYEQWIATLESKRENTPAHVFERVQSDYNTRLNRVLTDIKGHAEELQLSISALSSRLVEVARDEDTRRDALQEAELRATVGEYEPQQLEQLRGETERGLETVAADRASLDGQLTELRSIQKLSEVGSTGNVIDVAVAERVTSEPAGAAPVGDQLVETVASTSSVVESSSASQQPPAPRDQGHLPLEEAASTRESQSTPQPAASSQAEGGSQAATAQSGSSTPAAAATATPGTAAPVATTPQRTRTGKTPPFGSQVAKPKPPESRIDQSKTLKCPECGTANYATEWYCERCGGELATM